MSNAYAILDSNGKLTFFRSNENYTAGIKDDVVDVAGNHYSGQLYVDIETININRSTENPWYNQRESIKRVEIANNQIISPINISYWFWNCKNLTVCDLNELDTSRVTSIQNMFFGCDVLETLDLSNWNISNMTDISYMFHGCNALKTLSLSNWDISKVTDISHMFERCTGLRSLDLSNWDTSNVTNMQSMFQGCLALVSIDLSNFNTSNVINMDSMFRICRELKSLNLSNWNISNVVDMDYMFSECINLETIYVTTNTDWDASSNLINSTDMFYNCIKLKGGRKTSYNKLKTDKTYACVDGLNDKLGYFTDINSDQEDEENQQNIYYGYNENYTTLYLSSVITPEVSRIFKWKFDYNTYWDIEGNYKKVQNIEVQNEVTFNVAECLFLNFKALTYLDLESINFDFSNNESINTENMFAGCEKLEQINNLDKLDTSKATSMTNMFSGCTSLTSLNLSAFNTSNVINMISMFHNCASLTSLDLSSFNTSNVNDMSNLFYGCTSLESINISNFNTNKTQHYRFMFKNCKALKSLDLSNLKIWTSADVTEMFYGCEQLQTIYVAESWADYQDSGTWTDENVFYDCSSLVGGKGFSYDENCVNKKYAMIDGENNQLGYFTLINSEFNPQPTDGTAYAVLDEDGKLTLFRSYYTYSEGEGQTVYDIYGNKYEGQIYIDIETTNINNMSPWHAQKTSIINVDIADEQIITPISMAGWFNDCINLVNCNLDELNTSNVTNMSTMFMNCFNDAFTTPNVSNWDTSNVTDMSFMFYNCSGTTFTAPDVSNWDTSKVTDMNSMFCYCSGISFTIPDVSNWDTSSVTNMSYMFSGCSNDVFIAPNVSNWDTSNVTNMSYMFSECEGSAFTTPDVSKWDTSNVTNMSSMFANCFSNIFTAPNVSNWDTSNVTDMSYMFYNCCGAAFTAPDVSKWDTSSVTNMNSMFMFCLADGFTTIDVSNWNTLNVTDMNSMFQDCSHLTEINISNWDMSKVENIGSIFERCYDLKTIYAAPETDLNINSTLTYSKNMFNDCLKLKGGKRTSYNELKTDKAYARIDGLNNEPGYFTSIIPEEKKKPTDGIAYAILDENNTLIFFRSEEIYTENENQVVTDIYENEYTGHVYTNIETINANDSSDIPWYTERTSIINIKIANEQIISPINTAYWFYDCWKLETCNLNGLNTLNVTNMSCMFSHCEVLTTLNLGDNFDTSKVTDMKVMFSHCYKFISLNLDDKFNTSNVTNMHSMFNFCQALTSLNLGNNFNTSNVVNMSGMFGHCNALITLSLGDNFDTSNVTNMEGMFNQCYKLTTLNLGNNFNTSVVENMDNMFNGCQALVSLDLGSKFDTSNVKNMNYMFNSCQALVTIYISIFTDWNINLSSINDYHMFDKCISLKGGRGTLYDNSKIDIAYAHVDGLNGQPGYFTDINAEPELEPEKEINSRSGIAYAVLNENNTLIFFRSEEEYTAGENQIVKDIYNNEYVGYIYTNIETTNVNNIENSPWYNQHELIKNVKIADDQIIMPINTSYWFNDCNKLCNCLLDQLDTSNIINMSHMFNNCNNNLFIISDVSSWDTSNVTDMSYLFNNCSGNSFVTPNVSKWNTSNVKNIQNMFAGCNGNSFDPPNMWGWDISKVENMSYMFKDCNNSSFTEINILNFNPKSLINTESMFENCTNLKTIYVFSDTDWNISYKLINSNNMFKDCSQLVGEDKTLYDSSHIDKIYARVGGLNNMPGYFSIKDIEKNIFTSVKTYRKSAINIGTTFDKVPINKNDSFTANDFIKNYMSLLNHKGYIFLTDKNLTEWPDHIIEWYDTYPRER